MKTCPIYIDSRLYTSIKRIAKENNRAVANLVNDILAAAILQYDEAELKRRVSQME